MECNKCGEEHDLFRCQAHAVSGKQCGKLPMDGTHVCRNHGGANPTTQGAIARRKQLRAAQQALETFGLPREVDPHTALLEELHRCAGAVEWLGAIVADLQKEDVVWGMTEEKVITAGQFPGTDTSYGADLNTWVKLWHIERDRLVKVSKACVDAGIEERKVRVVEQAGQQITALLTAVISQLNLSPQQQIVAGQVIPAELQRMSQSS